MSGADVLPDGSPQGTGAINVSQPDLAALLQRVERLESQVAELKAAAGAGIPRDLMLVISAAVAAYLGKRATIKQVRLVADTTWASTGRAQVHSSHRRHG
jgi:methylmalonyl-CoA carboxyltransferase large subunit